MPNNNSTVQDWIQSWFNNELNNLIDDWTVIMANTLWEIWKARCRYVFEDIKPNTVEVLHLIQLLNDSTGQKMSRQHQHDLPVEHQITLFWKPPTSPYISFCCDASFKIINQVAYSGWGLICRSFAGEFIQARCGYSNGLLNAEMAECRGLLYAMQCAEELDVQFAVFEMDAELVIKAANGNLQQVAWENQTLIQDIKLKLETHPSWIRNKISRKVNKPADTLAKHARIYSIVQTWQNYPPSFIANAILEDTCSSVPLI